MRSTPDRALGVKRSTTAKYGAAFRRVRCRVSASACSASGPMATRRLGRLSELVQDSGLEGPLLELVQLRASQINGCAVSHRHALQGCTSSRRDRAEALRVLSVWQETPFFTEREQAPLALTEAVTLIADAHVPETLLLETAQHFSADELSRLV